MKPWLASILVLLVLLCAAIANSLWITGKCSRWQQELDEMAPAALEDPRSAISPLQELAEQWQQAQFFLRMVTSHQELDEIQLQLAQTLRLCQQSDGQEAFQALLDLRDEFGVLKAMEGIRLENIF